MPQSITKDSLTPVGSQKDTSSATSLFQEHLLQVKEDKPVIHYSNYDYLIALLLFIAFSLFVWLYVSNSKRLRQLIREFYSNRQGNRPSKDEFSVFNRTGFILSILFLLTITLYAGEIIDFYGIGIKMGKARLYGTISIGLIIMYLVKSGVIRFTGFIFKTGKEAQEYTSAMFLFINVVGLFMLPVVICLTFVDQVNPGIFIYTGYFILGSFLCLRVLKGLVIGFGSNRVSKFYLFLYLCTLEIIPFIILIKLFLLYIA